MGKILVSDVNDQRRKISAEGELLAQNPTAENMRAYQVTIRDFVSFAVTRMYMTATKSAWKNKPQKNFYAQIGEVDDMLYKIVQSADRGDKQNLIKQCGQMNELLEKLFWYN